MVAMPVAMIDGDRFIRAWQRFRSKFPEDAITDDHRDMLEQYRRTAEYYHDLAREHHEVASSAVFMTIVDEVVGLIHAKCQPHSPPRSHIPTPAEIFQRRNNMVKKTQAKPVNVVVTPTLDTAEPVDAAEEVQTLDVTYDDLKSMLAPKTPVEENLSTSEMRRRFGLSNRDDHTSTSDTLAKEEQEAIQSDIMNLATTLKERTQGINETLADDIKIIDAVEASVESNAKLLERENGNLKQQLDSSIGFWTSLWLVMGAVMVFMATYIYMKLFSRRQFV